MANHKPDITVRAHIVRHVSGYWLVILWDRCGRCEIHRDFDSFEDALAILPMIWRK